MTVEELSFPSSTMWLDKKNSWLGVRDGKGRSRSRDVPGDDPDSDGAMNVRPQQLWPRVFPGL
jgi:hypothetical protein